MPCPAKTHGNPWTSKCTCPGTRAERRRIVERLFPAPRPLPPSIPPDADLEALVRRTSAAGKLSRPRPALRLRRGSLTVNRARLEHRKGRLGRPGLELFGEIYDALLNMKFWRREDFRQWDAAAADRFRQRMSRTTLRSFWEVYLFLHSTPHGEVPETWRSFAARYLVRRSPGLRWIVEHDAQAIGRLAEELGKFARSGGGGRRPRHRTPETLAIALTAAALRKDPKSVARRVNLDHAPSSVSFVPRPQ